MSHSSTTLAAPSERRTPPLAGLVLTALAIAAAVAWHAAHPGQAATLWQWLPALLRGFTVNIGMGLGAAVLSTLLGLMLGIGQLSPWHRVSRTARWITLALRNAPWLVIMFAMMAAIPFEIELFGHYFQPSDWAKVLTGLALGGAGYVSEIVRGGLRSIPAAQWEAAASLALSRRQTLTRVILPQALRSMVPAWMNLYCTLTMATSLSSLMGIVDMMTVLQECLAAEANPDLLLPAYGLVCVIYFLYIYPFSRWSRRLERRWSHHG